MNDYDDEDDDDTRPCPYCKAVIYADAERCPRCENYITEEDEEMGPSTVPLWVKITALVLLILSVAALLN